MGKEEDDTTSIKAPIEIRRKSIIKNHYVASRDIKEGETILFEADPISVSPIGFNGKIPYCVSCCKEISTEEKCSKCSWPLCSNKTLCKNNPIHEQECQLFSKEKVQFDGTLNAYFGLETLRGLFLRDKKPEKWLKLQNYESHCEARMKSSYYQDITKYVMKFILDHCKLGDEFDESTVDHVCGIFVINTFWTESRNDGSHQVYASCLYDIGTFFAHSCSPNANRYLTVDESTGMITLTVVANRNIQEGEMVTIKYWLNDASNVHERKAYLKKHLFFDCMCDLCKFESSTTKSYG